MELNSSRSCLVHVLPNHVLDREGTLQQEVQLRGCEQACVLRYVEVEDLSELLAVRAPVPVLCEVPEALWVECVNHRRSTYT